MSRTILEQEFYEQFRDQGMDEYEANEQAREWAIDSGEYDEPTCSYCDTVHGALQACDMPYSDAPTATH